jgi:hypothetical protein
VKHAATTKMVHRVLGSDGGQFLSMLKLAPSCIASADRGLMSALIGRLAAACRDQGQLVAVGSAAVNAVAAAVVASELHLCGLAKFERESAELDELAAATEMAADQWREEACRAVKTVDTDSVEPVAVPAETQSPQDAEQPEPMHLLRPLLDSATARINLLQVFCPSPRHFGAVLGGCMLTV